MCEALAFFALRFSLVMQCNRCCYKGVFHCLKVEGTRSVCEFCFGFLLVCLNVMERQINQQIPSKLSFFFFPGFVSDFEDALIILSLEFYLPYFPGNVLRKNRSRNKSSNTRDVDWPFFSFTLGPKGKKKVINLLLKRKVESIHISAESWPDTCWISSQYLL